MNIVADKHGQGRYRLSVLPSSDPYHSIAEDVSLGMERDPPVLPERYFYDELGSSLFENICQTEDYYPTRLEDDLIEKNSDRIIDISRPQRIVELGSGSCTKTRKLFDNASLRQWCQSFVAIDVSRSALEQSMRELSDDYAWLSCQGIAGDYVDALSTLSDASGSETSGQRSLFLFFGGSIGNFSPEDAVGFLKDLRPMLCAGDHLLIGIDALKSADKLNRAYNDREQYTARFNLNMLRVINRELGADFNLSKFRHCAEYLDNLGAVQMSLVSTDEQVVCIPSLERRYSFRSGQKIITEHSYKYTGDQAEQLLCSAGFSVQEIYQPPDQHYHLLLASP